MNEMWKSIEGYEGEYEVSSLGRVRSLKYGKVRVLKQNTRSNGYCKVGLLKKGKKRDMHVHRLVAAAFLPNPENLPQINHLDENRQNNNV